MLDLVCMLFVMCFFSSRNKAGPRVGSVSGIRACKHVKNTSLMSRQWKMLLQMYQLNKPLLMGNERRLSTVAQVFSVT